jgi:hypothetical protein
MRNPQINKHLRLVNYQNSTSMILADIPTWWLANIVGQRTDVKLWNTKKEEEGGGGGEEENHSY